jgi:hypothetical protein
VDGWNRAEEGNNAGEAQERRIGRPIQGEGWRIEGDAKLTEDALDLLFQNDPERVGCGNTPRTTTATCKVEGGAAKVQRAAPASVRMRTQGSREPVSIPSLEGQVNTTGAGVAASATANGSHTSNL